MSPSDEYGNEANKVSSDEGFLCPLETTGKSIENILLLLGLY